MKGFPGIKILFYVQLTILVGMSSCVKETVDSDKFDKILKLNSDFATPLGYLTFDAWSVITHPGSSVRSNAERILTMNYLDTVYTSDAGSLFHFSPQTSSIVIRNENAFPIDLSKGGLTMEDDVFFTTAMAGKGKSFRFDSISVDKGFYLTQNINLPFTEEILKVDFPDIRKGNGHISQTVSPADQVLPGSLDGCSVIITGYGEDENRIPAHIRIEIPSQEKIIQPGEILAGFDIQFQIDRWNIIFGFKGSSIIDMPLRSFNITYDSELPDGEYYFSEPRIRIVTLNSFGLPAGLGFRSFNVYTRASGSSMFTATGFPMAPEYFYPEFSTNPRPLVPARDSIIFSKKNSNIVEMVSDITRTIIYQPEIKISGDDREFFNFISSKSRFGMKVELELPFAGYAGLITMRDTLPFRSADFSFSDNTEIGDVVFDLYYENSFPADVRVQLYLADANLNITDTLFALPVSIVGADPTGTWQNIPRVQKGSVDTGITPEITSKLLHATYLIAEGKMHTSAPQSNVKIFDNQSLLLKAGVIFNLDTKTGNK